MKKLFFVNTIFLIIFALIWLLEAIACLNYDSIFLDNKSTVIVILILLILSVIYLFYTKFKMSYINVVCLFVISSVTLLVLKDSILFYLPVYHNERFVIRECIVIYYSLLTFGFSIISGVISVIYSIKHSNT